MALQRNLLEIFIFFLQTNFDRTIKTGEENVKIEFFFFFVGGNRKKNEKFTQRGPRTGANCRCQVFHVAPVFCFVLHDTASVSMA